jgi:PST family polysaccharide transporter
LIGAVGLGLYGNYVAIMGVAATLAGLGIQSSAVRDLAQAIGQGDRMLFGRTVLAIRRVCWVTGLLGCLIMIGLSTLLSNWTFGSEEYAFEIALLGPTILLANVTSGQTALIQGAQRIGDLARVNIISSIIGAIISISLYLWLGVAGILPTLILMSGIQCAVSWSFARKIPVPVINMSWWNSIQHAGGMVRLGVVFMWDGLIVSGVAYATRALITKQIDLEAVGIFSAAYALSGMLVGFILGAMGSDYYPRLSKVASDHVAMNRLINEQTEIGLLLAVPGVMATLTLAPWLIQICYTVEFLPATDLLQWFCLGGVGRIISFPLAYAMLALGKGQWFVISETITHSLHLFLVFLGLNMQGIDGVAIAFFVIYLIYTGMAYGIARHLTNFHWSVTSRQLIMLSLPMLFITLLFSRNLPPWPAGFVGFCFTAISAIYSLRALVKRIGTDHHIVGRLGNIPGIRLIIVGL